MRVVLLVLCLSLVGCGYLRRAEEREALHDKWQRESFQYISDTFDYISAVNAEIVDCHFVDDPPKDCDARKKANAKEDARLNAKYKELLQMQHELGIP